MRSLLVPPCMYISFSSRHATRFFSFSFINRHGNVPFLLWVTGLFIVCMCASGFQRCNDICSANCQRFVSSAGK